MKRLLLSVVLLLGLTAVQAEDYEPTLVVSSAKEFIESLGSNRTIVVAHDTEINLTPYLSNERNFTGVAGRASLTNEEIDDVTGPCVISEYAVDGQQLTLKGLRNLIIQGERGARIVVEPRYSYVFSLVDCEHVTFDNLTIGHTEGGFCMGGVIHVKGGRDNMCRRCDLYGCGTYGLTAENTLNVSFYECVVHDCTYGLLELWGSEGCRFYKTDFCNTGSQALIMSDKSDMAFDGCRFYNNDADQWLFLTDDNFVLVNCDIYHPADKIDANGKMDCPRNDVRIHSAAEGRNIRPEGRGADMFEEQAMWTMRAQNICGTWKWTDNNGVALTFTLALTADGRLEVQDCSIYGSTEFTPQCTYINGELRFFDDSFATPRIPAFEGTFILNEAGDLKGLYMLRQNGGNTRSDSITLTKVD